MQQSIDFNNNFRGASAAAFNPDMGGGGYQYKVLGGADIQNHQSNLAAAYQEQAQLDAERQQKLDMAAENDRIKAEQQQAPAQTQAAAGGGGGQDNTMQYVKMAMGISADVFLS